MYTVRPISDRTAFTGRHERSRFDSTWTATEQLLKRELEQLRGSDVVLEIDITERDLRIDGTLRANARPTTPAVRIAFESKHGPLTYATDAFTTWQDNVRAIALGLEALRKVDRYGITKRGEQYAGWKALPSGSGAEASHMTRHAALGVLGTWGRYNSPLGPIDAEHVTDPDSLRSLYRAAQRATHPDHNGGSRALWNQVEQAAKVLGLLR
jgi:hypothetical protein